MIVVDAAAVHDYLLADGEQGEWALDAIEAAGSVHAPHLIDFEIVNGIRRRALAGEIPPGRAREALDDLSSLRLERYPARELTDRIWELRHRLSAYDAAYVALAEALDVPLITTDERLARAGGHRAEIRAPG